MSHQPLGRSSWESCFLLPPWESCFLERANWGGANRDVIQSCLQLYCQLMIPSQALQAGLNFYHQVRTAIHHLSTKKSPGHDKIRAEYIKNEQCIHFLHTFFNTCFNSGKIPLQWSKSIIKPIPKCGGSSKNPGDYRGISIQSIALKTFCSILGNRLADFVETHELLVDEQNGFRKD